MLGERPDVHLLRTLADAPTLEIVEVLLAAPATQKEISALVGIGSSAVSRRMAHLEALGIAAREHRHGPYSLSFPERTRDLLEACADLTAYLLAARAEEAQRHAKSLRKAGMKGGRLRDRDREPS